jgi:hypothetical protein
MGLKSSLRIVPFSLPIHIKFSLWSRVIANARNVKPIARIAAWIIVDEPMLKPRSAGTPIQTQVVNGIGSNVLSTTIGHEPSESQFVHIGIHKRTSRITSAPSLPLQGMMLHGIARSLLQSCGEPNALSVLYGNESEIITPEQFKNEPVRAFIGFFLLFIASNGVKD